MEYRTKVFATIFLLAKFLNDNKISPQNIISITRQNISNGYGAVELLYMAESEE